MENSTQTVSYLPVTNNTSLMFSNNTTEDGSKKPEIYLSTVILMRWALPIIAFIGLLGNSVTIALMQRPKIRVMSMSIYFTALSAVDMILLVNMIFMKSLHLLTGYHIYHAYRAACAIFKFLQTVTYSASSWLVTIIAIERCLVVMFPFNAATYSNLRKAKITTTVLILIITACSSFTLVISDLQIKKGTQICFAASEYIYFEQYIRFQLMGILASYIPLAIMVVCNCILVYKIIESKRNLQSLTESSNLNNSRKFTYPALAICVAFFLLTVPTMVYFILVKIYEPERTMKTKLAHDITAVLPAVRASINAFLYIFTSSTFKQELTTMLCWQCQTSLKKQGENNRGEVPRTEMQDLPSIYGV